MFPGCLLVFNRKDNLTAHNKTVHQKVKVPCPVFFKEFHPSALKKHTKSNACQPRVVGELYRIFKTCFTVCPIKLNEEIFSFFAAQNSERTTTLSF